MKALVNGIAQVAPEIIKNLQVSIALTGAPAAVAVGCVCGTVVIVYAIYSHEKLEEAKLGKQATDGQRQPPDCEVDNSGSFSAAPIASEAE